MKSIAKYYNVGEVFVNVRISLYESCIVPSLLYNLEGWNKLKRSEIDSLEKIQRKTLCSLLQLPKTTPYIGLLNELGMWRVEEQIMYRKIMLYHNIQNSPTTRLIKRIVDEQKENIESDTFYADILYVTKLLNIDVEDIANMSKSQLKTLVKKRINNRMQQVISECKNMKKMRFVAESQEYSRKQYLIKMKGSDALKVIKTRLNMINIYGNFKGDVTLRRLCVPSQQEDDTTEHLIACKVFSNIIISTDHLFNDSNHEMWRDINELIDCNL